MTYNEKKSLYESIMKDVAKTVKRRLNESVLGDDVVIPIRKETGISKTIAPEAKQFIENSLKEFSNDDFKLLVYIYRCLDNENTIKELKNIMGLIIQSKIK